MDTPKKVPIALYKQDQRIVVGEATISEDEGGISVSGIITDENFIKRILKPDLDHVSIDLGEPKTDHSLSFEELCKAVDGLYAYDSGCIDSGIHDEELKARVRKHFEDLYFDDELMFEVEALKVAVALNLTPEARQQGYTEEDAVLEIKWMRDLAQGRDYVR